MIEQTTVSAILAEPFAFLRRPRPMRPQGLRAPGAWRRWGWLTALQVGVLLGVVVQVMMLWQKAFDLPAPDAFEGMSPLALWGGAVLLAPVLEELFFRAWLSGLPRALWAMGATVAGLAVFIALGRGNALVGGGILLITLAVAAGGWFRLRHRADRPGWFDRAFPALFIVNAAVFAAMHLANYPQATWLAIPMVMPQFWTGLMLGFVRLRIGLGAAILTHIISNAVALGIATASA
ncbi:MAG: CPBP family intramembrane metalloprotease [Novosphingobium sp.]|nr:CPBP family intramembrane metalloprotease [Novosphingobium sp.]